ncbi:Translin [Punctularia strigosozonata HHB-11173 SS5]|uniref:Translin n=1 Tax=Punctularia strigosozonata (strain HHB-11173) TaxID=741275 RepID=UPI00044172AB|nr:Translin [Punctularia strigosozonata HHB-11173 SS5]EIN12595.1 Translin [Punctularia strigosozonata HHB-11173 SS5]
MDPEELQSINRILEDDVLVREKIRDQVNELDKRARSMLGTLNKIHSTPWDSVSTLLNSVQPTIDGCKECTAKLAGLLPKDQFWRYKDMWAFSIRNTVFAIVLVSYLKDRALLPLARVSETLGLQEDGLILAAEDYLHGLISLVNELSRLAVNAVTMGNYEEPIKISIFVKDVFAGFSMLNLKNDALRRRYDSLKYDIKKIEEVVYDVSLRNLANSRP